jgi:hypothetical protein
MRYGPFDAEASVIFWAEEVVLSLKEYYKIFPYAYREEDEPLDKIMWHPVWGSSSMF